MKLRAVGGICRAESPIAALAAVPLMLFLAQCDNPSSESVVRKYPTEDFRVYIPSSCDVRRLSYRVPVQCFVWELREHCIHSAETKTSMSMEHSIA